MQNGIRICYDVLQTIETDGVLAPWNPESEIASSSVLFMQMRDSTGYVSLAVEVWIMLEAELYCPAYYGLPINHPVGFGHDHSIYASRCTFSGRPVVFCCLGYGLDLL